MNVTEFFWLLLESLLKFVVPFTFMLLFVVAGMLPLMIWMERKISAYIQDRRGPNRANILGIRLFGIVHAVADVIKLVTKEDVEPEAANKPIFRLAPFLVMFVALMTMAVIPFGEPIRLGDRVLELRISGLNAGILYIFAVSSLGVYGLILAGWSSANKYSFLGALRASSQMLSYEVSMGLAVIGILLAYGTTDLYSIVMQQGSNPLSWGVVLSPIGFLIFQICVFAETNRNPFDLPEGESELVAGVHLEYSSLKFALFFMGEYVHMIIGGAIITTLFFGGWHVPFVTSEMLQKNAISVLQSMTIGGGVVSFVVALILLRYLLKPYFKWGDLRDYEGAYFLPIFVAAGLGLFYVGLEWLPGLETAPLWLQTLTQFLVQTSAFCAKTAFFSILFIWVRWTLPRFRYDQLMRLGWKWLLPLGVANIFITYLWFELLKWSGILKKAGVLQG